MPVYDMGVALFTGLARVAAQNNYAAMKLIGYVFLALGVLGTVSGSREQA